jgi:hypothetical protein
MFKKSILLGLTAGLLAGLACVIFSYVYKESMFTDFSPVVSSMSLVGSCVFGCLLASLGYVLMVKWFPKFGDFLFHLIFMLLTFASIISPIMYRFPPELDVEGIDMITSYFIPFAMTIHFFPALIWMTMKPLFFRK